MTVSFVIVAKNSGTHLPGLLGDLASQSWPTELLDILMVLARSSDDTAECVKKFREEHAELKVRVFDNPSGTLASGWNIALANSEGEVIVRVDAHSRIGPPFVADLLEGIAAGRDIVGGRTRTLLPEEPGPRLLAIAESSRFGGGSAAFRQRRWEGEVDTLAHAAYRRNVFELVGGYDERLGRTEDNEMHHRMKRAGFRFYYMPGVQSDHFARRNLLGLLKQKFGNGLWIGLTLWLQPACLALRHLIPGVFVAALLMAMAAARLGYPWPVVMITCAYVVAVSLFSSREALKPDVTGVRWLMPLLPAIFLLMHVAYGIGTCIGLARGPWFAYRTRHYTAPWPVGARSVRSAPARELVQM